MNRQCWPGPSWDGSNTKANCFQEACTCRDQEHGRQCGASVGYTCEIDITGSAAGDTIKDQCERDLRCIWLEDQDGQPPKVATPAPTLPGNCKTAKQDRNFRQQCLQNPGQPQCDMAAGGPRFCVWDRQNNECQTAFTNTTARAECLTYQEEGECTDAARETEFECFWQMDTPAPIEPVGQSFSKRISMTTSPTKSLSVQSISTNRILPVTLQKSSTSGHVSWTRTRNTIMVATSGNRLVWDTPSVRVRSNIDRITHRQSSLIGGFT